MKTLLLLGNKTLLKSSRKKSTTYKSVCIKIELDNTQRRLLRNVVDFECKDSIKEEIIFLNLLTYQLILKASVDFIQKSHDFNQTHF